MVPCDINTISIVGMVMKYCLMRIWKEFKHKKKLILSLFPYGSFWNFNGPTTGQIWRNGADRSIESICNKRQLNHINVLVTQFISYLSTLKKKIDLSLCSSHFASLFKLGIIYLLLNSADHFTGVTFCLSKKSQ